MSEFEKKSSEEKYPYEGVPLTPAVVQFLIRKLFEGKLVERRILIEEVERFHLAHGGLKATAQTASRTFDKALYEMNESGAAENPSLGYWRIGHISSATAAPTEKISTLESPTVETSASPKPTADIELGKGSGAVYVYYFPTYRLRAQEQDKKEWPCKIGRTDVDPLERVLSQVGTALPERPHIAIIIRTNCPSEWEAALHGVLTLRGLQIDDVPGVEWFLTSPAEILELVKVFDPQLSKQLTEPEIISAAVALGS